MTMKTKYLHFICIIATAAIMTACSKGEIPTVFQPEVTETGYNYAVIRGLIFAQGSSPITRIGVCYAAQTTPGKQDIYHFEYPAIGQAGVSVIESDVQSTGTVSIKLTELRGDTIFYARLFAENSEGVTYSYPAKILPYAEKLQNRKILTLRLENNNINIVWLTVENPNIVYTTVYYTDESNPQAPVKRSIRVENSDLVTALQGLKAGEKFSIVTTHKFADNIPLNAQASVFDANVSSDLYRGGWVSILSHRHINESKTDYDHLDGDNNSYLAMTKPGKSKDGITVAPGEDVFFIVDMGMPQDFDYFRVRHRDSPENIGARWQDVSIYGSNDNSSWMPIALNVTIPGEADASLLETDNLPLPLSSYRYVKILLARWDTVNNSNAQMAEFYLGKNFD
jgi:hypothetical protein